MLTIESLTFGPFQENTYIVSDDTSDGVIVDPGCYTQEEQLALYQYISNNQISIKKIINTHCHIDHVLGNQSVKSKYQVPLAIPLGEKEVLAAVKVYATNYGFPNYQEAEVDEYISEQDLVSFGDSQLQVLLVPGHSPGHLAFYHADSAICLGGDVLFQGSIGRTDLPGGDFETLIASIHEKMFKLPDEVVVYCGHGPPTSIGEEKTTNPFCAIV